MYAIIRPRLVMYSAQVKVDKGIIYCVSVYVLCSVNFLRCYCTRQEGSEITEL